jgi:dihydroneopterin aldolase
MATVFVNGLEFHAYHGVSEQERLIGNSFRLDLEAELCETACSTDELDGTVDYGALALEAVEIATSCKCRTVERVVELIGAGLLTRFPQVLALRVRLSKLSPPVAQKIEAAGVERTFAP